MNQEPPHNTHVATLTTQSSSEPQFYGIRTKIVRRSYSLTSVKDDDDDDDDNTNDDYNDDDEHVF